MQFTMENQGTSIFLTYCMEEDDKIDSMSMGMVSNNHIEGVIPFTYLQMDNKRYLKYNVSSLISLSQYFSGIVNRSRLLSVMESITSAVLNAEEYMIGSEAFLWDKEYIFVDAHSAKAQMICMPIERADTEKDAGYESFFREMLFGIQFDQSENCDYVAKLIGFFNANPHFDLNSLSKVLSSIQYDVSPIRNGVPSSNAYSVKPERASESLKPVSGMYQSNGMTGSSVQGNSSESSNRNSNISHDKQPMGGGGFSIPPIGGGSGGGMAIPGKPEKVEEKPPKEKKKFSLFGSGKDKTEKEEKQNAKKEKEKPKKEKKENKKEKKKTASFSGMKIPGQEEAYNAHGETPVSDKTEISGGDITEISGGDVTEVVGGMEYAPNAWLELISATKPGAMPRIELNTGKTVMTVGRISEDEQMPDIAFPKAFKHIGRHHACIEIKDGNLYIRDLGSVNHTFLNGQELVPNQYYQLTDGMELTLAASRMAQYRVHIDSF